MNQKTILVTGAAGFTGRHLIAQAHAMGYRCVALCYSESESVLGADQCIAVDLRQPAQIVDALTQVQPSYIVHLAGVSFVAHDSLSDLYEINLIGTVNLLQAVTEVLPDVRRVILASSAITYGNQQILPLTEDVPAKPANHYGVTKMAMEEAAKLYINLPIIITRPFNYTGVGQADNFLIPKMVGAYKRRDTSIELGNLDVSRDFTDVRDLVDAYLRLLQVENFCAVYNICSGTSTSLLSIVSTLNNLAGYTMDVKINPAFVRADEIKELYGSNKRLADSIGAFGKYQLEDTIGWMLEA